MLIKFKSLSEEQEPTSYLKECITTLNDYSVDEVVDRYLVGLGIRNTENVQDKVATISFQCRDRLNLTLSLMYSPRSFRAMFALV